MKRQSVGSSSLDTESWEVPRTSRRHISIPFAIVGILFSFVAMVITPQVAWAAQTGTVLIVAPHPDDDLLFGSGIAASALAAGREVKVVYMTNGDIGGKSQGLLREGEAVLGQSIIGNAEQDLIFLGYPDGYLKEIFDHYPASTDVFLNPRTNLSTTYGARGLGGLDYHTFRFGAPASYNAANILQDLESIIGLYRPDDIYTTSEVEGHSDHTTTYRFVRMATMRVKAADPTYTPSLLHKTIVWWGNGAQWPVAIAPQADQVAIPGLSTSGLEWVDRDSFAVTAAMQSTNLAINPKYLAIDAHQSQGGATDFLAKFIRRDEIFWPDCLSNRPPIANAGLPQMVPGGATVQLNGSASSDPDDDKLTYQWTQAAGPSVSLSSATAAKPSFIAPTNATSLTFRLVVSDGQVQSTPDTVAVYPASSGGNIASLATVTASSQNTSTGQLARKAVDGVVDGYPGDYTREWATVGGKAGSWLRLVWPSPRTISKIVLYDRPNANDQITAGTLRFSDGSTLSTGSLNNDGTAITLTFPAKSTVSVELTINAVKSTTSNVGLAEIQVWTGEDGNHDPVADAGLPQSVAIGASVQLDGSASTDVDGDPLTYQWTQTAGPKVALSSTTVAKPVFTAPGSATNLTFQLVVSDGQTQSTPVTVTITTLVNIASQATVTASSENSANGQLARKAVDGVVDGYPGDATREWATVGGKAGSWLRLAWPSPRLVSKIVLHDRPNTGDRITAGTLRFSDGSTISTCCLNNNGTAVPFIFPAKTITSVELEVDAVKSSTANIGLAEIEVWTTASGNRAPVAEAGIPQTVTVGTSVQLDGSGSTDPDGDNLTYRWTQTAGPAVTLSSTTASRPTFTAPSSAASLSFQLVVSDGQLQSSPDTVIVTVQASTSLINIASQATVTASSQNTSTGQLARKAVDGVVDGYPGDYTREWATVGGKAGSWLRLAWPSPRLVSKIVLHDRPNTVDQITAGTLRFSDGSTLKIGSLSNNGTAVTLTFPAKTITSIELTVDAVSAATYNVGLAEIAVWASGG